MIDKSHVIKADKSFDISSEIHIEKDSFEKRRINGPRSWILAHLFYKKNKFLLILYVILSILANFMVSFNIVIIGYAIGDIVIHIGGNIAPNILFWTVLYLSNSLGTQIIGVGQRVSRIILAQRLEAETRKEFYMSLLGKSQSFHDKQAIGDIMARATNDVRFLNFLINPGITNLAYALNSMIVPIVTIFIVFPDLPQLGIIPVIFVFSFLYSLKTYVTKLTPLFRSRQAEFANMNAILNESLDGIEVIKSMAQEKQSIEKYRSSAIIFRDLSIKGGYIQARYYPRLLIAIAITLGLTHGFILNYFGVFSVAEIIIFLGLLTTLRNTIDSSLYSFYFIKAASIGAERLIETMLCESEISNPSNPIRQDIEGGIVFDNISFSYPGTTNYVLRNVSFEASPGQTVAIVGTTGSGKTTLTKLISRLYDINEGRILIDNVDIRKYSLNSLREQIAYIEQDVFLFSKSAFENIAFGRESFTKDEIINAAKEAQAHDFITELPDQYEAEVGERGVQLSGGERQRIAIARAFLSDPKILVLDDASSAIDAQTEEKIQKAISKILRGRTTLLITHRLSQIRWADLIIVLKKGQIVAKGSHKELLRSSEEYRKIFIKRFDKTYSELIGEEEK
ncbi:MAG: ABC transporter ATP-binding protein [Promethearchaeota archaeon]|jgi:ATP-binding cassette subfamily B protein